MLERRRIEEIIWKGSKKKRWKWKLCCSRCNFGRCTPLHIRRNDRASNINSNLSNVCSSKVECCLRGFCAGGGLELFWTIQILLSMTATVLASFLQILTEGLLLQQLKLDSLLWYSACLHFMMPERSWSVDQDDCYAASIHLFWSLYEIFICSITLLAMLSGLFISA